MKTQDQNWIWAGSLVHRQNLLVGSMTPVNIPSSRRKPFFITTTRPSSVNYALIQPTQTDYNIALATVRQGMLGQDFGDTINYQLQEQASVATTAMSMGLNVSFSKFNLDASGGTSTVDMKHRLSAIFVQNAFTMNTDLQGNTPEAGLLINPTAADLAAFNDAAYVDSVTYGRMLYLEMTSNYSSQEMMAALKMSYGAYSGNLAIDSAKILSESNFKVYAAGGHEASIINLIKSRHLNDYFDVSPTPAELVPISFTARNVSDQTYAVNTIIGDYAETTCNPYSVKVHWKASWKLQVPATFNTSDAYGSITIGNGSQYYIGSTKNERVKLNGGETLSGILSGDLTLNYGEHQFLPYSGTMKEYHKVGSDTVTGQWNGTYDLKEIADRFQNGEQSIRKEFWYGTPGARPSSELIIDFSR